MSRCLSPCDGSVDDGTYAALIRCVRESLLRRPDDVVSVINRRMEGLAADERFEEAGVHRDRLASYVRGTARTQRLAALVRCEEVVATRREADGRWAVHVVRFGRLAGAGVIPAGANARAYVDALRADAETVRTGTSAPATAEESERILRWLESPGLRLVSVTGEWSCPVDGASRHLARHTAAESGRDSVVPFDERRALTPEHRPAR